MGNLNLSRLPERQEQGVPLPNVVPSGGEVAAIEGRMDDAEAALAALDTRIDALETGLNALGDYADDAAAETGGVVVGGRYRTGSVLKVRIA